jgi:hypothetical protein
VVGVTVTRELEMDDGESIWVVEADVGVFEAVAGCLVGGEVRITREAGASRRFGAIGLAKSEKTRGDVQLPQPSKIRCRMYAILVHRVCTADAAWKVDSRNTYLERPHKAGGFHRLGR